MGYYSCDVAKLHGCLALLGIFAQPSSFGIVRRHYFLLVRVLTTTMRRAYSVAVYLYKNGQYWRFAPVIWWSSCIKGQFNWSQTQTRQARPCFVPPFVSDAAVSNSIPKSSFFSQEIYRPSAFELYSICRCREWDQEMMGSNDFIGGRILRTSCFYFEQWKFYTVITQRYLVILIVFVLSDYKKLSSFCWVVARCTIMNESRENTRNESLG